MIIIKYACDDVKYKAPAPLLLVNILISVRYMVCIPGTWPVADRSAQAFANLFDPTGESARLSVTARF